MSSPPETPSTETPKVGASNSPAGNDKIMGLSKTVWAGILIVVIIIIIIVVILGLVMSSSDDTSDDPPPPVDTPTSPIPPPPASSPTTVTGSDSPTGSVSDPIPVPIYMTVTA